MLLINDIKWCNHWRQFSDVSDCITVSLALLRSLASYLSSDTIRSQNAPYYCLYLRTYLQLQWYHPKLDKANDTEHSDVKKSRSALKRAAAKKPVATGLGANISALTSVKLEGYGTTGLHSKSPGPKAINAVTSSSNTVCFFALATAAHFSVTRPDGSIVDFACKRSLCSMRHPALCDITQGEAIQVCEKFKGPNGQALADHIKGLPGASFKV